ncbi:MAG TPA: hypothetical protein V6C97_29990 [Oculatellaceae cyanobacterium]
MLAPINRLCFAALFAVFLLTDLNQLRAYGAETDPNNGDIFSTPDTHVLPTFAGRVQPQQPPQVLAAVPAPDPPDREALLAIPTITPQQRTQINNLYQQSGTEMRVLQGQLESLRRALNQKRTFDKARRNQALEAPGASMQSTSSMQMMMSDLDLVPGRENFGEDSVESINAHIEATNQQIKDSRLALWRNCESLLSPEQMRELQTMQRGKLFISSNGSTNVPEPVPAAKPVPPSHQAQPGAPRLPSPVPKSVVLNTTKQLLYRVLWRL